MYGMASGASVSDLFLAGIIPGLMIGVLLMLYAIYHCKRYGKTKKRSMQKSKCCMTKVCFSVFKRKFFCTAKPGDHSWMYLQRCRFSD